MLQNSMTIKQWSEADKPREKLRDNGAFFLSDAELLAIIIGSGTRDMNAVDLSKIVLSNVNYNLNELGKLTLSQLTYFKGIGEAKAIKIMATMELGRRHKMAAVKHQNKVTSSISVFNLMQPLLGALNHEEFWLLYLNNSNKIVTKIQLSKGGITATVVDVRLVLKKALEVGAISIILVHNHPSGTLQPSQSDINLTKKLKIAAQTLEIKVLDHIIVTEKTYFSFTDEKML
jgi:DNA repair protein RadC